MILPKLYRPAKTETSESGFTIVELIIAMIVGTGFIIMTNSAVNDYTHLATRTRQLTLANSFAEGEFESLRNSGYNSLNAGTTDISSQLPAGLQSPKNASLVVSSPTSGIKQVDLTISYSDQAVRTYSYTTYIGELGVGQ